MCGIKHYAYNIYDVYNENDYYVDLDSIDSVSLNVLYYPSCNAYFTYTYISKFLTHCLRAIKDKNNNN